jgi:DNA-binding transcriptional LysR family regulator
MELRQIEHFVAVTEEMHFTRAARRMNVVQSALSASIAALEAELGARLFHRTTRQVRMTAAGEAFYEKARSVLDAVRQARASVAATQGLERGRLIIGTVQSLPAFIDIPGLLATFHARHPAIQVSLRQDNRLRLVEQVADGRCDLALLPVVDIPAGVEAAMVVDEAMVMVCAPGHPLAGRPSVALEELSEETFVDFRPGWGTRSLVDAAFAEAGITRRTMFETPDLDTLLELVVRGLGVALAPERNVTDGRRALRLVRLAGPAIRWKMMAIYAAGAREGSAPAANAFLSLLDLSRIDP